MKLDYTKAHDWNGGAMDARVHASVYNNRRAVCHTPFSELFQENSMSQNQSGGTSHQPPGQPSSESEEDKAKREAGVTEHSSHDHTARERAGSHEGAGGGAKQKQNH